MSTTPVSTLALSFLLAGSVLSADGFSTVEYVKVTRSAPVYAAVQEEIPEQRCYEVQEPVSSGNGTMNNVVGAVAGGALGGVLGHQIGGGSGKTVATVGGAVLGTLAGQKVASTYGAQNTAGYQTVRKCETIKTYKSRQVLSGYTNTAIFKGREISVESDQPLKQIPVTVTYSY